MAHSFKGEMWAGQADDGDAPRPPHKLIAVGAGAVLLLAAGLVVAAYDAAGQIDGMALAAETRRAERALEVLAADGTVSAGDVDAISRDYLLTGARLSPDPAVRGEVSVPVPEAAANAAGEHLAWTPRRFGREAFSALAPRRILMAALVVGVIGAILYWLHRIMGDLDRHRQMARELASRDMLTGLANRLCFDQALRHDIAVGAPFALFYLDLDSFKLVNDTLGHAAGDRLLASVGARLTQLAGPGDLVARLGGDEFAVIRRSGITAEELAAFARETIVELCRPVRLGETALSVGVSIGIALASRETAEALLSQADAALYRAKAQPGPAFEFAQACERTDGARTAA
jgi:diguanylate cyclase (GGDEF)-like protein